MTAWLLVTVWCLLLAGGVVQPWLGSSGALVASYAASAILVLATRPHRAEPPEATGAALAAAAGFAALPAWLAAVALLGAGVGLPPPALPDVAGGAAAWLAHVGLAPLIEELLYRERLLPALRARVGSPLALVLSSAFFALPHLEPWGVLTTFFAGLALGGLYLASARVELCVAYHAGLNAAVLVCGVPPVGPALPPVAAALVGGLLLALAVGWTRRRGGRRAVHAPPAARSAVDGSRA